MDIYFYGYPLQNVLAWVSLLGYQYGYSHLYGSSKTGHPTIMDIHVDIRGFLETHVWICYGFSDQSNFSHLV